MDGEVLGKINTGEWLYFEVSAGTHEVSLLGGLTRGMPYEFASGQNYFFHGNLCNFSSCVAPVYDEEKIHKVIEDIESGRYEHGDID